ncbi:hypothetical protein V8C44DRAFT_83398 [Trichoderma aethiopicum]
MKKVARYTSGALGLSFPLFSHSHQHLPFSLPEGLFLFFFFFSYSLGQGICFLPLRFLISHAFMHMNGLLLRLQEGRCAVIICGLGGRRFGRVLFEERAGWSSNKEREASILYIIKAFWAVQFLPPPLDVIARIGRTKKVEVPGRRVGSCA